MSTSDEERAAAAAGRKGRVDDLGQQAATVRNDIDALEAELVVDREVIAHLQAEGLAARDKIANLELALATARRIGAAIGILMARQQLTADQAFDVLRDASQQRHRKLREIADELLLTGAL